MCKTKHNQWHIWIQKWGRSMISICPVPPLPESSILLCNLPLIVRGPVTPWFTWPSAQCSQDLLPQGTWDKQCHLKSIQINPFVNEKIAIEIAIFKTLQLLKNGIFQFMVSFHIRSDTCFAHSSFQRDFCLITKIIWELTSGWGKTS